MSIADLEQKDDFISRHIGPRDAHVQAMLRVVGASSLDDLTAKIVPASILEKSPPAIGEPMTETEALRELQDMARQNKVYRSLLGLGYYDTITPNVILRNVLQNPGWYTAYTPYQPEISQGRLEALVNYQQMVMDLTAMPLANASMLDEGTAAAEAMTLAKRVGTSNSNTFFVDKNTHPQTIALIEARAKPLGIEVVVADPQIFYHDDSFGILLQYPDTTGEVSDYAEITKAAHAKRVLSFAWRLTCWRSLYLNRPANGARILCSGAPSASACRWATADRMPLFLQSRMNTSALYQGVLSAYPLTARANLLSVWLCKPANSISAARRRPAISAPHKCCWRISPGFMLSTTALKD